MSEPLPFDIIAVSSEEPPFTAAELLRDGDVAALRGWRTARNCSYPQELILRFGGDVALTQLQLLSHECLVASRVEVHAFQLGSKFDPARPPSFQNVRFQKLGSIKFNPNDKSKYRSKERKTVHLKTTCYFLKLVFHEFHPNHLNTHGQVGIYSIAAAGSAISFVDAHRDPAFAPPPPGDALPPIRGTAFGGDHGQQQQQPQRRPPNDESVYNYQAQAPLQPLQPHQPPGAYHSNSAPYGGALPPLAGMGLGLGSGGGGGGVPVGAREGASMLQFRSQRILDFEEFFLRKSRELATRKAQAVGAEDFDAAKVCKEALLRLQDLSERIYALEGRKVRAIYDEDFKAAAAAKTEMDAAVEEAMAIDRGGGGATSGRGGGNGGGERAAHGGKQHRGRRRRDVDNDDDGDDERNVAASGRGDARRRSSDASAAAPPRGSHSFEDQPVLSKYAQMMAQQQRAHEEAAAAAAAAASGNSPPSAKKSSSGAQAKEQRKPKQRQRQREEDDDEDEEGDDADDEEDDDEEADRDNDGAEEGHTSGSGGGRNADVRSSKQSAGGGGGRRRGSKGSAGASEGAERNDVVRHGDEGDDDAEGGGAGNDVWPGPDPAADPSTADAAGAASVGGAFKLENFPDWERDVYFAIADEVGAEANEPPAEPLDGNSDYKELPQFNSVFGHYATACLFSRRWRLRDAAVKVVTKFLGHHFRHVRSTQVVQLLLRYIDFKGLGLLDPIQQVFVSVTEFIAKVIEEGFEDCPLSAVQNQLANLLPRLVLRAGDTTQKIRDDAMALILLMASSAIGPERVAIAVLADPVDHDKRRMTTQNVRVHTARLLVLKQLLAQHQLQFRGTHLSIDALMTKLLLPSLNHSSAEVRELALSIVAMLDSVAYGQEMYKYVGQIANPAVRSAVEERLGAGPDGAGSSAGGGAASSGGGGGGAPGATGVGDDDSPNTAAGKAQQQQQQQQRRGGKKGSDSKTGR